MKYFTGKIAISDAYELRVCKECRVHFVIIKRDLKGGKAGSYCSRLCRSKAVNAGNVAPLAVFRRHGWRCVAWTKPVV